MRKIPYHPLIVSFARTIGIAGGAIVAGAVVRLGFLSSLEHRTPWITFYSAVMAAAVFGAWRAGALVTLVSTWLVVYGWSWLSPRPFMQTAGDWVSSEMSGTSRFFGKF